MKITKLELKNFKRFDDLTIDLTSLAEPAKLVLVIGTNGSGKSSVFDGFEVLNKISKNESYETDLYYKKNQTIDFSVVATTNQLDLQENVIQATLISGKVHQGLKQNSFYGRTSVRQVPRLTRTNLGGQGQISFDNDTDRPRTFIDRDSRFENDIEKVVSSILTDVFKGDNSVEEIKRNYVDPINQAFEHIFGLEENIKIKLISLKPPLEGKTAEILFQKGNSIIPYNFLSGGEKEIFNVLLNLLTRIEYFEDTIYFLDEIDLHLNTELQKNLLKEITENWIPEKCQLWTASHSLGFIEYANEAAHAAIIDFDNLNFDVPQVILPSPKNNSDVFEIAVSKDFLTKIFEDKKIVFSENTDTPLYNNLNIKDTIFFNAQNKADVFYKAKNTPSYNGLVDRDYLTNEERADLLSLYKNLFILDYYSIENYLFHPDNLEEYNKSVNKPFDKAQYIASLVEEKQKVKDKILLKIAGARDGYPFYREHENSTKLKNMKSGAEKVLDMLNSDELEAFYKVFPAKDYSTQLKERQNITKIDLAKTNWFKTKIEEVLTK